MAIRVEKTITKAKVAKPDQAVMPTKSKGKGVTGAMMKRAAMGTSATAVEHAQLAPGALPGRPASGKVVVTLRLEPEIIERFKATGPGWQARMNDVLRRNMP